MAEQIVKESTKNEKFWKNATKYARRVYGFRRSSHQ